MSRYRTVKTIKDRDQKKSMYIQSMYPPVPTDQDDIYIYATEGDRYDLIAQKFYGDATQWYIIALANADSNTTMASLFPPLGKRIRIPIDNIGFENRYNRFNKRLIYTQTISKRVFNTGFSRYTPK
tara:strand:+ start:179 stop:556 length:378 start_codon:yes stop_codon:yes gene_type:complete